MNKRENIAGETERLMRGISEAARAASRVLALASTEQKNAALIAAAKALRTSSPAIIAANAKDIDPKIEKAWGDEAMRRLKEIEKDKSVLIPGEEAMARVRKTVGL